MFVLVLHLAVVWTCYFWFCVKEKLLAGLEESFVVLGIHSWFIVYKAGTLPAVPSITYERMLFEVAQIVISKKY